MTMAEDLAARLRPLMAGMDGITEQRMFGGRSFMLHGNMLVGAMKGGTLLVRVSPERTGDALSQPGATLMTMGTRQMKGFIGVTGSAIDDDEGLARWIAYAEPYVRTLPRK